MDQTIHHYQTCWHHNGYRVIDCQTCGFIHLDPIPTGEQLAEFYAQHYFRQVKPFAYEKVTAETIQNQQQRVLQNTAYHQIYQQVAGYLQNDCRRMLDIGCGNHLLTYFFKEKGWTTRSLNPAAMRPSICKNTA